MQIKAPATTSTTPASGDPIIGSVTRLSSAIAHAASSNGSTIAKSAPYASCPKTRGAADSIGSECEELMHDPSFFVWTIGRRDRPATAPLPFDRSGEHARQQRRDRAQRLQRVRKVVLAQHRVLRHR